MYNQSDKKVFKFILNEINKKFINIRKPKYSNEYYLNKIIFVTKTGISWRDSTDSTIKNHYSTIFKKYKLWSFGICFPKENISE